MDDGGANRSSSKARVVWLSLLCGSLLVLLILDFMLLPVAGTRGISAVGQFRDFNLLLRARPTDPARADTCLVYVFPTREGAWSGLDEDQAFFAHPWETRDPMQREISVLIPRTPSGLWAPTWLGAPRVVVWDWKGNPPTSPFSPDCVAFTTQLLRDRAGDEVAQAFADHATGKPLRGRVAWLGVVHDLASLCAAIVLVVGSWKLLGAVRSWRRERSGRCARCKYALAGLVGGVCPECGTPIGEAPA
ncbi:MAG: hypothetical protein R3B57_14430 [Phycisphaerales bacterium]